MTARDDLLAAATRLTERGETPFSPRDLIREARADGSTYEKSTLQTHIVGSMCVQATDHWGGHKFDDFDRVARGQYVLAETAGAGSLGVQQRPTDSSRRPTREPEQTSGGDHRSEWFWEGNVQAAVVAHLAAEGWRILRVADTHSREHGVDIQARRRGTRLLVEVKGYPSSTYARGDKAGQPKKYGTGS